MFWIKLVAVWVVMGVVLYVIGVLLWDAIIEWRKDDEIE